MELRESLMQSEIQHLNKKLFLLSAEIIFVQDFIREQFGSKFEAFCNARREQQQIQNFNDSPPVRSTSAKGLSRRSGGISNISEEQPEVYGNYYDDPLETYATGEMDSSDSDDGNGSDGDDDRMDGDGDEFEIKPDLLDLHRTEIEPGKKGRRKSIIHRYYQKVMTDDGHLKNKCYTCGAYVSGQAQRLRKHLIKCKTKGSGSKVDEVLRKMIHVEKAKAEVVVDESALNDVNKKGRRFDRVRLVFKKVKDMNGFLKMKCLNCGHLVSNQPSRMRKHLEKCREVGHQEQDSSNDNTTNNSKEIPSHSHAESFTSLSSFPNYTLPSNSLIEGADSVECESGSQNYIPAASTSASSSSHPPPPPQITKVESLVEKPEPQLQLLQPPSTQASFTNIQNSSESNWSQGSTPVSVIRH